MCGNPLCAGCPRCAPGFGALDFPRNAAGEIVVAGLSLSEWGSIATVLLAAGAVYGAFFKRR